MELDKIKKRAEKLKVILRDYDHNYYMLSKSVVSDFEYDSLLKELQNLEEKYPELSDPNSPTKRVGGEVTLEFETITHKYPMLSLDNTYSKTEIADFDKRIKKILNSESSSLIERLNYVCELKYDGVAIGIIYKNGKLFRAVTRGDGLQGDDVTANVKTIKTIPLILIGSDYPDEFEIRGEIFLSHSSFEKINKTRIEEGESPFSNPRNSASGTLKMQDSAIVAIRNLDCYVYSIYGDNLPHSSHYNNMQAAKKWGFNVPDDISKSKDMEGIYDFIDYWEKERNNIEVDIDGIVLKVDDYELHDVLGFTAKSPRWAISYKYKTERALTKLLSIDYQIGRTGAVTPVANLEPILLGGTIVKRASLHNADQMTKLDIRKGDMIFVEKGGEIIPKIVGVELSKRPDNLEQTKFIEECPECNTRLVKLDDEAAHYCPNVIGCAPQIKENITHFISRKAMNIDGIGEETVSLLFDSGLIKNTADLYDLKYINIIDLDRFADKSVKKLLLGIEASKKIPFEKVLFALGIRYVGVTVAKKLAFHFNSLQNIRQANLDELMSVEEIGHRIAESLLDYFNNEANCELINRLYAMGISFEIKNKPDLLSEKLANLSFVVSGVFQHFSRDELKEAVTLNAGKVVGSISAKTSYVIAGENMGPSKLEKAKKLDVKIISENDFIELIKE